MTRNEKKTAIENMAERFMNISDLEGKSIGHTGRCGTESNNRHNGDDET